MSNWSKYQTAFFAAIENGTDNIIVSAVPGSGKTTSIEEASKRCKGNVLDVTFTNAIADEMIARGLHAMTLNKLGFGIVKSNIKCRFNKYKVHNILINHVNSDFYNKHRWKVARIVGLMKGTLSNDVLELMDKYGVECDDQNFPEICTQVFHESVAMTNCVDFDDQLYFPHHYNLPMPAYSVVFVDEAQDLNAVQIALLEKMKTRLIFVGDENQAIYGFRGSGTDSMDVIQKTFECQKLPLSICYRCPRLVVDEANKIYNVMEAAPNAIEGVVQEVNRLDAKAGDIVLCRTTAPLVRHCLDFVRKGQAAYVKGREVGDQLISKIDQITKNQVMDTESFLTQLETWWLDQQRKYVNREDALSYAESIYETLIELADGQTTADVKRNIERVFKDAGNGVILMTGHRAKGLQANRVFLIEMDKIPHPRATDLRQEENLRFVMTTRPTKELYYF